MGVIELHEDEEDIQESVQGGVVDSWEIEIGQTIFHLGGSFAGRSNFGTELGPDSRGFQNHSGSDNLEMPATHFFEAPRLPSFVSFRALVPKC